MIPFIMSALAYSELDDGSGVGFSCICDHCHGQAISLSISIMVA